MVDKCTFDTYRRYENTRLVLELICGQKPVRVLEVGSSCNRLLESFLPSCEILYAEPHLEEPFQSDPAFVEADGCNLPFEADEFDFIVFLDVLEHIPSERRETFLGEMLRVAQKGLFFSAPFESEEVRWGERQVNHYYRALYDRDHPWIKEHFECGLPLRNEIEDYFENQNMNYFCFEHGSMILWTRLMKLQVTTEINSAIEDYGHETLGKLYRKEFFHRDFDAPCYHTYGFIAKEEEKVKKVARWYRSCRTQLRPDDWSKVEKLEKTIQILLEARNLRLQEKESEKDRLLQEQRDYILQLEGEREELLARVTQLERERKK